MRYFCQDESRFGLKTIQGRKITLEGVKPTGKVQWVRQAMWIYGAVEPRTGEGYFHELPKVDHINFQGFLEAFSKEYPNSLNVLQVDNAKFHTSKSLVIPENIILLFQPPHSPELNPIERIWQHIKRQMRWKNYASLDELRNHAEEILIGMGVEAIGSITGWSWILGALSSAGI